MVELLMWLSSVLHESHCIVMVWCDMVWWHHMQCLCNSSAELTKVHWHAVKLFSCPVVTLSVFMCSTSSQSLLTSQNLQACFENRW